jgi:hypothetical protein
MRDFIARHPEDFTREPRVRFSQIFLSRQRRGAAIARDADGVRDALASGAAERGATGELGDPSPFPVHFPLSAERDIAKAFGTELAASVMRTAPGHWTGPLASAYGLHFILVRDVQPAALQSLEAVRERARYGVVREREADALSTGIRELRRRYDVRVAGLDATVTAW